MNTNSLELILASGSPRRQAFFKEMGLSFRVEVVPVAEDFPAGLNGIQITEHIVRQKAEPFLAKIQEKQLIILLFQVLAMQLTLENLDLRLILEQVYQTLTAD